MLRVRMTKKKALRRLEDLALDDGHKRNYYVKRALVEFLRRNENLLGGRQAERANGYPALDKISCRLAVHAPQLTQLIRQR